MPNASAFLPPETPLLTCDNGNPPHMKQVKKRNGTIVDFEANKITEAMRKSFEWMHVHITKDELEEMTKQVVRDLEARFADQTPSVENVQDIVEFMLMQNGHFAVARHYIVYRYEHHKIREEKKQEVIEKVEEKRLMIKTAAGKEEPYAEEKVRANLMKAVKGHEDVIDVEGIMALLKYELYEGMTTDEVTAIFGTGLSYVAHGRNSEIYAVRQPAPIPGIYPPWVEERLYLQFREGRLTGWKNEWEARKFWF